MNSPIRIFLVYFTSKTHYSHKTPPIGLLYLASYVRERHPVEIVVVHQSLEGWSDDTLVKRIEAFKPEIVGISCMTPASFALPKITTAIKAVCPDSLIILGGPHISSFGPAALNAVPEIDLGVVGEGELLFDQIVEAYRTGSSYETLPGLIRRENTGEVVVNPGIQPFIEDLDFLPFPAYDLIEVKKFWTHPSFPPIPRRKYASLFTSRGCPYGCIYCHNVFGKKFRVHSADRIVDEVQYHLKNSGIDEIEFIDDCFNLNKKRVLEYSSQLLKKNGPVKTIFPNAIRADIVDEEMTEALVSAGMYYSALALESGSPRIQKFMRKNLDIPAFLKTAELFDKNKVFTNVFAMLGFPTETEEEIKTTIQVASDSAVHVASFFTVTPFANTALARYVEEHMPEKAFTPAMNDMEYWKAKINLTDIPDKVFFSYQRKAFSQFYFKPSRMLRLMQVYPKPHYLPSYIPMFMKRLFKELF